MVAMVRFAWSSSSTGIQGAVCSWSLPLPDPGFRSDVGYASQLTRSQQSMKRVHSLSFRLTGFSWLVIIKTLIGKIIECFLLKLSLILASSHA